MRLLLLSVLQTRRFVFFFLTARKQAEAKVSFDLPLLRERALPVSRIPTTPGLSSFTLLLPLSPQICMGGCRRQRACIVFVGIVLWTLTKPPGLARERVGARECGIIYEFPTNSIIIVIIIIIIIGAATAAITSTVDVIVVGGGGGNGLLEFDRQKLENSTISRVSWTRERIHRLKLD